MSEAPPSGSQLKRKRSSPSISSLSATLPPQKAPKIATALQINYLARQQPQDLPLLNKNDTIPNIIDVLQSYTNVLDRHESLASNLGARPLGPILIKRFERCFDAPPEIIASHSHAKDPGEIPQVTWLEVIQFAQSHPGQFTLSTFSEGRRVCQFYYPQKQVRVQVSEEDFLFIKSGRCQDLIPPLPIWEDEEKEVGTCEILEKQLRELTNAADTVAARTRQLSHRLKGRRMAIMERRAGEKQGAAPEGDTHDSVHEQGSPETSSFRNSGAGFTAVNGATGVTTPSTPAVVNGETSTAPVAVRSELLKHFQSLAQNQTQIPDSRRQSLAAVSPMRPQTVSTPSQVSHEAPEVESVQTHHQHQPRPDPLSYYLASSDPIPPVATTQRMTPSQGPKHNFSRPLAPGQEISQPFRSICQAHMESLPRGSRVIPPCDRCRRLKMDCLKNLTSCQGCTKKHARCHWKEVGRDEVEGLDTFGLEGAMAAISNGEGGTTSGGSLGGDHESDDGGALDDLEALDRDVESDHEGTAVKTVEDRWSHGENTRPTVDRGPVITAATVSDNGSESEDKRRNIFGGGLPYSPNAPTTSFREARDEQHHHHFTGAGGSPISRPASSATAASHSAALPDRHNTQEKMTETRLVPFPPFEPPTQQQQQQTSQENPAPRTSDTGHSNGVTTNGFRPQGFTSVNDSRAERAVPASGSPEAHQKTNGPSEQGSKESAHHSPNASHRALPRVPDQMPKDNERTKGQQEAEVVAAATATEEATQRREDDRAVSPFSATFARPHTGPGQGGANGRRNPFEGASNGVSVGGGNTGSSGWRGM